MDKFLEFKKEIKKLIDDKTLIKKDKEVDGLYNIFFNAIPVVESETREIIRELLNKYGYKIINDSLVRNSLKNGKYLNTVIVFRVR